MGIKIPQQSSPRRRGALCGYHILRKLLKNGAAKQEVHAPILIRAHIQLVGGHLPNNHTFKLLSGLLMQTHSKKTITPGRFSVNRKSFCEKNSSRDGTRLITTANLRQLDKFEFGGESPLTMRYGLRRSKEIVSRQVAGFRSAYGIRQT